MLKVPPKRRRRPPEWSKDRIAVNAQIWAR